MLRPYWSTCWGPIWPLQSERSCAPKEPTWKLLRCAMLKSLRGSDQPCSEGHYPQIGPQKPSRITKTSQSGFMGTGHCSSVWALDKKSRAVIDRPYSLGCATVGALYERPRCIFCAKSLTPKTFDVSRVHSCRVSSIQFVDKASPAVDAAPDGIVLRGVDQLDGRGRNFL